MSDGVGSTDRPDAGAPERLDSWKEIAAYLKRDVTTVRRWEKREGLPVHRHLHERRDSVYAYAAEIEAWWAGRRNLGGDGGASGLDANDRSEESTSQPATAAWARRAVAGRGVAAVLSIAIVSAAAVLLFANRPRGDDRVRLVSSLLPPAGHAFVSVALSPDGRHAAFTTAPDGDGPTRLWVRALDSLDARLLADTEGAAFPFWSPESDAIGFFAAGKLWTARLAGGGVRLVAEAPEGRGGTWNRDDVIVFAPGRDGPLFRVAAAGGPAAAVTEVSRPLERGHVWPEFLPDGRRFLYLADTDPDRIEDHSLMVGTLHGAAPQRLMALASSAAYSPDGYLVFERERQLFAQPFDASRQVATGEPAAIADRVQQMGFNHKAAFSVSANGVLLYRRMQNPATRLVWRDRTRQLSTLAGSPAEYFSPALSPDESRVAAAVFDPKTSRRFGFGPAGVRGDIWILDRATGAPSQFTSDPAAEWGPVWSPDGRTVVFASNRRGPLELFQKDATAAGADELLLPLPLASIGMNPVAQSWSPDGRVILFSTFDPKTRGDLWLLPMSGDRTPVPLLRTRFSDAQGQISPDGRWFAYTSNESGRYEVWVARFPTADDRQQVSTTGGGDPRWRRDGRELFYVADDRRLMAVRVEPGKAFEHGDAVPLFDTGMPPSWYEARNLYDVTRDGRFLFMVPIEDDRSLPATIVVNWTRR